MKKILLIVNTIRFLKIKQLIYQVIYKLKSPFLQAIPYSEYYNHFIYPIKLAGANLIPAEHKYFGGQTFCFLNLEKRFISEIDWNFTGYGKLWNYNLQYFDYLHDLSISDQDKKILIENFCEKILKKKVSPEPYPTSIRIINWIIYSSSVNYSSSVFTKALQYQIDFLRHNLEYHILANHLLENYFALLFAGYSLRDEKLSLFAAQHLRNELLEQTLPDGGHYECSPMYHSIILSKLILAISLLERNSWIRIDAKPFKMIAERMLGWLHTYSYGDTSIANFNDATANIAISANTIFAAAKESGLNIAKIPLQQSGYRKFKMSQYEVIVKVGNVQPSYQAGHTHSDMLHFCCQYKNYPFISDTGISTYNETERRLFERSTKAHNTVTIQEQNQSRIWKGFRMGQRARLTITDDRENTLTASHDGYLNDFEAVHERSFDISENSMILKDKILTGKSGLEAIARLYFHYDVAKPQLIDHRLLFNTGIAIEFINSTNLTIQKYRQSVQFNKFENSHFVEVSFTSELTTKIIFN